MLDFLDSFGAFLKVFNVEIASIVWEILALDTPPYNLLVEVVHPETWHIAVIVRPLVAF